MKVAIRLFVLFFLLIDFVLADAKKSALIIPIHGEISGVQEFILRRGLKLAQASNYDGVILDINTPGGRLDTTLKMIEMLKEYDKPIAAYINSEAISAGSYISIACDEIYFNANGIIGAAAVVSGSGANVDETMRLKIDSYLRAKVRNVTSGKAHRADVQRAMMDENFVFTVGGVTIKQAGELLSLTAEEASKVYGESNEPLLAAGTFDAIEQVAEHFFGENGELYEFELTGFEQLAKFIQAIAPILIGLGGFLLMLEFKTPGFGLFGALGIASFSIVLFGNFIAGLAGLEAFVVMLIGAAIVLIDFTLLGTFVLATIGSLMIVLAIWWSNIDFWPNQEISWTKILIGAKNLMIGIAYLIITILVLFKLGFFKNFFRKFKLETKQTNTPQCSKDFIGKSAIAITPLLPSGKVQVDGTVLEAQLVSGSAKIGDKLVVIGKRDFEWLVSL